MASSNPGNLSRLHPQKPLESLGQLPLRAGGSTGARSFWRGEWAEMGERIVQVDVHRCPSCGHLELFDFDASLPEK